MSRLVLDGGTDVAEMMFFSLDELPSECGSKEELARLEEQHKVIRLPTGADGSYLLHLYVDEEIPDTVRCYCSENDALHTEFETVSGRIAFGGTESAYDAFETKSLIRSDANIPPGRFKATAFRTDFPDDQVDKDLKRKLGAKGAGMLDFPGTIFMLTAVGTLVLSILGGVISGSRGVAFATGIATIVAGRFWYRSYTGTDEFARLNEMGDEIQREYPSIVIRLEKSSIAGG